MNLHLNDTLAVTVFLAAWLGYNIVVDRHARAGRGLTGAMNAERRRWMQAMLKRDLRMIDTAIMAGLQQGTAFFASACIFAIGGCFALLGSAEEISAIAADLPFSGELDRALVELKLFGLIAIFCHAFFKFGWSYRLFNYCSILIGAVPMREDAAADMPAAGAAIERAAGLNQIAGRHFNAGLRSIFFAVAYLGWLLGPLALVASTVIVVTILAHRQFHSRALKVIVQAQ
ncbi:DUF599 domain-containing protein [Jiella marina]|uniref:DUF599 domain-containing protein n=1 Tax=Jiella sp. LLJ827 TaxID=2917712 RepID=UPI002100BEC6|nr:DUF599 family protein [Jiella sp. LLJ827]MCQ0989806.1 DUF599 family protein [Jiella sp. LLJ827]